MGVLDHTGMIPHNSQKMSSLINGTSVVMADISMEKNITMLLGKSTMSPCSSSLCQPLPEGTKIGGQLYHISKPNISSL